jgi:DNA integrity scanning protein DisA with diadenylate cyclase activity
MREFSALDGGFLVDRKGTVEAAGVYLDAPVTKSVKVPKGLGSRHLAAAAATAKTDSLAIVISESSGSVTVFFEGARVLSLGKPGSSKT